MPSAAPLAKRRLPQRAGMLRRMLRWLCTSWIAAALAAQAPTYPHLVLTRLAAGNPAAAIVAVDTATSTIAPRGRFPADNLPPLAIALDPFNRHVLVALLLQPGTSRIVRLQPSGLAWIEHPMCDVPGRITDLWVADDDLLIASDASGVWRAPRRGGPATLHIPAANLTAMHGNGLNTPPLTLGWTGRPGTANPISGIALVDSRTGAPYLGPFTFTSPANVELTGAIDLPTGVPRQLLSFADGSFWLFAGLIGPPTQLAPSVPIPQGGAVAMAPITTWGMPLVLGGAAFPHLYEIEFWSGTVTMHSAALPGDPVDFCAGGERAAFGYHITQPCGPQLLRQSWGGQQQPGATLTLQTDALGSTSPFVLLCMGLTDLPGLPATLPGGCQLHIAADALLLRPVLGSAATHALPIPNHQAFLGTMLYAQWFDLGALGLSSSDAVVHHIGR